MLSGRRRMLMGVEPPAGRLPRDYQEVEWIGVINPATVFDARIMLGYVPKVNPRCEAAVKMGTSGFAYFWGRTPILYQQNGNTYANYGGANTYIGKSLLGTDWKTVNAGQSVYINGTLKKTFDAFDWSQNDEEFSLFWYGSSTFTGSIKYAKLYDGDTLVRDLVPCYKKRTGRPGFYCLVSKVFYTNVGDANILQKGPDVI